MSENGSRDGAINRIRSYLEAGEFEFEVANRVAHRTESQKLPDSLQHLHNYLEDEMVPAFEAMGFAIKRYDNPIPGQAPAILASRIESPTLPTVLGYGHGDVIRGLDDQWTKGKGPWITARDGDHLYGRGTADNKAQHTINMAAMRAVLQERGQLGFNAKFLIEMGEEAGSKGLPELINTNKSDFSADVFIASDGPRVTPGRPTVSLGCRGAVNFDLVCDLRAGGHHSGNWGGLLANPGIVLAHAIATIVGPKGELLVEALKPPAMTDAVREVLDDIKIDGGINGPTIDTWWGEPDLTPPQRVYAANVFNVLAYSTGTPGRPVNAIPPMARANCQLRFVAGTDSENIIPILQSHLDKAGFDTVKVTPPPSCNDGVFNATRTEPDHPWAMFVRNSLQRSTNSKPAIIPSMGGSICNDIFTDDLGLPAIWLPHSYTSCSQHAPDEHVLLSVCRSALEIMTGLYWDIGTGDVPRSSG